MPKILTDEQFNSLPGEVSIIQPQQVQTGQVTSQFGQDNLGELKKFGGFVGDVGIGAAKGLGSSIFGTPELLKKGGEYLASKIVGEPATTGFESPVDLKRFEPKGAGQWLGYGAEQIAELLMPVGAARTATAKATQAKQALSVVLPKTETALRKSGTAEKVVTGLSGKVQAAPTREIKEVAESVEGLVNPKWNFAKNISNVRNEIVRISNNIRNTILPKKGIFNQNQLTSRLNQGKQDLNLVFESEPYAEKTYNAVVKEFLKQVQKGDLNGLFDARIAFDKVPAVKALLESDKLGQAARGQIVKAVRRAANQFVSESLSPEQGKLFLQLLSKESKMFDAIEMIQANAPKIGDVTTRFGKVMGAVKKALPYVVTGGAAAGGAVGAQHLLKE